MLRKDRPDRPPQPDDRPYEPLGHVKREEYAEIFDEVEEHLVVDHDEERWAVKHAIASYCRSDDGDPASTPDTKRPVDLAHEISDFDGYWPEDY